MFISEDGTVTGSVDVSKLDQLNPKSDEAKAQVEALKADVKLGQEQAARDAERLAEQHRTQNAALLERSAFYDSGADRDESGKSKAEQRKDAERQQAEADKQSEQESAEVTQLQADAEKAGITVDKRWGADRLRQELASAQSAKGKGR